MIVAGWLLLTDCDRHARLAEGWLRLADGRIAELQAGPCPHTPDLGGDDYLITPGFIDAHLHLPQFDSIGVEGLPLLEWLDRAVFPAEARWEDEAYAAETTDRVVRQLLSFGTTSFCAYATVHHAAAVAALDVVAGYKLRACVGQVLMDVHAPEQLVRPVQQLLDETAELLRRFPPSPLPLGEGRLRGSATGCTVRVEAAVTPRFAVSCSAELLRGAASLAHPAGAIIQTHLAETLAECDLVRQLHNATAYTDVYEATGLLTPRTILGHGIHLAPEERRTLVERQSIIAHCPTANLFLCSGLMPRAQWLREGVRLTLGSDIGAGPERSMIRAARAMLDTAKHLSMEDSLRQPPALPGGRAAGRPGDDILLHHAAPANRTHRWGAMGPRVVGDGTPDAAKPATTIGTCATAVSAVENERGDSGGDLPTAAEAWWQITRGNADTLGWTDVGRLEIGAAADLLIIRPDIAWHMHPDPLALLLYAWDDRWLKQTLILGRTAF